MRDFPHDIDLAAFWDSEPGDDIHDEPASAALIAEIEAEAVRQALPINALVARIDVLRMEVPTPPGLASAVRLWLASQLGEQQPG